MTKRYKNKWDRSMNDMHWDGSEDGYEYSGKRSKRLRRNKIDGVLGGVCAGIGDYFDIDPVVVRVAYVASVLFLGVPLFIYFLMWIFVPSDHRAPYIREHRQARKARRKNPENPAPTSTYRDVKGKFRSLEQRLQDLEKSITSSEWQLRREFRDLEN
jgi:phage shock protein C